MLLTSNDRRCRTRLRRVAAIVALAMASQAGPARAADPTTADCLGANDAAIALRNAHKLREARAQLLICAAASCPADVRNECVRKVADVNRSIPTIVFEAKDAGGNDLVAVRVTMDGAPLLERLEGTAVSIDPGEHSFTFQTADKAPVQRVFILREGEKERRERVVLGEAKPATAPPPASPGPVAPASPAPEGTTRSGGDSTRRVVGIVLGAAGLVGVGVAVYEQVTALNRQSDSESAASNVDPNVQATSKTLHHQAIEAQTYAIVSGALGVAAIGAGVILIATSFGSSAPKPAAAWTLVPEVAPTGAGLSLAGRW
jgi:hypothetical protein